MIPAAGQFEQTWPCVPISLKDTAKLVEIEKKAVIHPEKSMNDYFYTIWLLRNMSNCSSSAHVKGIWRNFN